MDFSKGMFDSLSLNKSFMNFFTAILEFVVKYTKIVKEMEICAQKNSYTHKINGLIFINDKKSCNLFLCH